MFSTFLCPKTYIPTSIRNILIENHKKKSQNNESTSVLSINITWLRKDQKEPVLIMRNSCVTTLKFVFNQKSSRPKRFFIYWQVFNKKKKKNDFAIDNSQLYFRIMFRREKWPWKTAFSIQNIRIPHISLILRSARYRNIKKKTTKHFNGTLFFLKAIRA